MLKGSGLDFLLAQDIIVMEVSLISVDIEYYHAYYTNAKNGKFGKLSVNNSVNKLMSMLCFNEDVMPRIRRRTYCRQNMREEITG